MTSDPRTTIVRRLDLEVGSADRAKAAYARKIQNEGVENVDEIEFREMVDAALVEFLPQITDAFEKIRLLRPTGEISKRPRPVSVATWERLGEITKRYDVSRVQLIRCALALLGETYGSPKATSRKRS